MLLSICIVTYNRPNYLDELLESIDTSGVTRNKSVELIVLDNGSSDETRELLESWKRKLEILVIRNQENERGFWAYKRVIGHAKGEWIISPGDDDRYVDYGLQGVLEECKLANEDVSLIAFGANTIDTSGNRTPIEFKPQDFKTKSELIAKLLFESPYWMPATAIRRSMVNQEEIPNSITVVDWWLWINAAVRGKTLAIPRKIIDYRLHEGQEQRSYLQESWDLDRILSISRDIHRGALRALLQSWPIEKVKELLEAIGNEVARRSPDIADKIILATFCQQITQENNNIAADCKRILITAGLDPRFSGVLLDSQLTNEDYTLSLKKLTREEMKGMTITELERQLNSVLADKRKVEIENAITPFERKVIVLYRKIRFNLIIRKLLKK